VMFFGARIALLNVNFSRCACLLRTAQAVASRPASQHTRERVVIRGSKHPSQSQSVRGVKNGFMLRDFARSNIEYVDTKDCL